MDFIFDYISVNAFWTIVLIIHALLAVATLGALTHQAMSVAMPARQIATPAGFVTRFRAVYGAGYATAVCVLWVATFILGAGSTPSIASRSAFRSSAQDTGRRSASSS